MSIASRQYACVLAREACDCGPAALATVAKHHNLHVSLPKLRQLLSTDFQGTSLAHLQQAAVAIGFSASCGKARVGVLDQVPLPAIAHFDDTPKGHFVVVHQVTASEITVADPARGVLALPRSKFLERWSGYMLLLAPSEQFQANEQGPSPLRALLDVAFSEKKLFLFASFLGAGVAVIGLGVSLFAKVILDRVIPQGNVHLLHDLGFGILGVVLLRAVISITRQYFVGWLGYRLELSLGLPYTRHVLSLPLDFFDKRSPSDIYSRVADVSRVRAAISGPFLNLLLDLTFFLISASLLLWYSPVLALTVLAFLPAIIGIVLVTARPMLNRERETRENMTELASRFTDAVANIKVVKSFSSESLVYQRLLQSYRKAQEALRTRNLWADLLAAVSSVFTSAASVVLLWVGTLLVLRGRLSLGQLIFFYSISGMFLGAVDRLSPSFASVQEALLGIERLQEVREVQSEKDKEKGRVFGSVPRGEIELRNMTFWYRPGFSVLSHIDLKIRPGEWVAVLGETGSGKSTLASLIAGLHSSREGAVLADGVRVDELDPTWWRRHVAVVFQEPGLMQGTVRENIAVGNPDASLEQIQEAARLASIHDFIMGLPKGYEYDIGPAGVTLSSGQRQRLALARAFLKDAPVLVLDEATSNLDPEIEQQIMRALKFTRKARTTIIITHRLQVAMLADRSVVLQGNTITEEGSHEELLALQGKYCAMWRAMTSAAPLRSGELKFSALSS